MVSVLGPTTPGRIVLGRTSFRFTADGRYVACLAQSSDGGWYAECQPRPPFDSFAGAVRVELPIRQGAPAQVLPRSDGGCWVCQPAERPDLHEIVLATPGGTTALPPVEGLGGRLVPAYDDGQAYAVTASPDQSGRVGSVVYALTDEIHPLLSVPGLLGGGVRLDRTGRVAFTRAREGRLDTVVVDPNGAEPSLVPLWPDATGRRVLLADNGLLVVAEQNRFGWCHYSCTPTGVETDEVRWPGLLDDGRALLPLAIEPGGRTIAFRVDAGARTELYRYAVDTGAVDELDLPTGVLGATGAWTGLGLSVPFAEPGRAASVRTLLAPDPHRHYGPPDPRTAAIQVQEFDGVQAVIYGDLDRARTVVVALHGGPDAAWSAQPVPLLDALARSGEHVGDTAVVAVNPSGSRGRPPARFGHTDVDDVRTVVAKLSGQYDRIGLVGSSYGGYLALRVLCAEPTAFSRVCLLAPLWSGRRLAEIAGPRVRLLLRRLGELERVPFHRLEPSNARVLLLGGGSDDVIPPVHLDELTTRFRDIGAEVRRVDWPDAGHDLLGGPGGDQVIGEVVSHLVDPLPNPRPRRGTP